MFSKLEKILWRVNFLNQGLSCYSHFADIKTNSCKNTPYPNGQPFPQYLLFYSFLFSWCYSFHVKHVIVRLMLISPFLHNISCKSDIHVLYANWSFTPNMKYKFKRGKIHSSISQCPESNAKERNSACLSIWPKFQKTKTLCKLLIIIKLLHFYPPENRIFSVESQGVQWNQKDSQWKNQESAF